MDSHSDSMRLLINAASLNELKMLPIRGEFSKVAGSWAADEPDIWAGLLKKVVPGINVLGTGANAVALDLPGDRFVLKAWKQDPAYEAFIGFCQKYSGNGSQHLPRFVPPNMLRKLRKNLDENIIGSASLSPTDRFHFVIVERLDQIPYGTMIEKWLPEMAYLAAMSALYITDGMEVVRALANDRRTAAVISENKIRSPRDLSVPKNWKLVEAALGGVPVGWKTVIKSLSKLKSRIDTGWDLHDQNIMLRGETLVINDPFHTSAG